MLDEILQKLSALPDAEKKQVMQQVVDATKSMRWIPNVGPQTEAYFSLADITYYGGAGGGGKSDWGLGLAFTAHQRSLIMRRKYTDLSGLTERAIEINGTRDGYNGSAPQRMRTVDGRLIEFGAAANVGDEESWQGRPHDLLYIDEAAQFTESQVRFLMGWVRSTTPGQRTRVCLGSNPPLSDEGAWLVSMFAPWLDPAHPNPAKPGELRHYITDDEGRDIEVDGPGPHQVGDRMVTALSRTFIPAKLKDNPYLNGTTYQAQQDALPEPLRSAIRDGDFVRSRRDHELQLIPTDWIKAAQDRWTPKPVEGVPQCAIGVDVAQGGDDKTVLSIRHDAWFAPMICVPGRETPLGRDVAGLVISHRRDQSVIVIDMGGGYGGSTYEQLSVNVDQKHIVKYKGSESSNRRTLKGALGFYNRRAEVYYRVREALDPSQVGGALLALPPDPELVADLCAIRLDRDDAHIIQLESKKNLVARIGRSTDKGDALAMCWSAGNKALTHAAIWREPRGVQKVAVMGRHHRRR